MATRFAHTLFHTGPFYRDRVEGWGGQVGEGVEPSITGDGGDGKASVQIAAGDVGAADGRAAGVSYRSLNAAICSLSWKACG